MTTTSTTRELIADGARSLFESKGYAATSVREIAAVAGIDAALVIRHFGSKEMLFLEVVGLDASVQAPVEGPVDSLGERLVGFLVAPERADMRASLRVQARAADRDAIREGLRLTVKRMFIDRLVEILPGGDREVRAELISAQLGGLVQSADVIEHLVLDEAGRHEVVKIYGRAVQAIVDAP